MNTGEEARRALRVYMEQLSQDRWCAGWLIGLEYELWDQVECRRAGLGPPRTTGPFAPPPEWDLDADTLAWLADQARGWWRWPDQGTGPVFVEMGEWVEVYGEWKRSKEEA